MLAKIFTQRGLNFSGFRCGSSAVKFSPAGSLISHDESVNRQMCRSKCGDAKGGKGGKGGKDGKGGKGAKGAKGGKGGKGGKEAKCGGDGKDGKDGKGGKGGKDGKDGKGGKGGKFDIKGKNIIFVAGLGSIGKDTSKAILKKAPKNLILLDTKEKEKEIKCLQNISPDTKITYMPYDVTVPLDESKKLMGKVFKKFEKIDLLINGAGILDDHAIEKTIAVNFTGMVNTTVAIMDFWDKRNGCPGGICANICSVTAFNPIYQVPVYCASKTACLSFTISTAILSPKTGITAYSINPGITRTPLVKGFNSWLDVEPCVAQMLLAHPTQSTKEAAKSFVKAIEENKNGAIWKLDLGKLTKVKWTEFKHWDPKI